MQELTIGEHWISHIGSLQVHMDTLVMMWTSMAIVVVFALLSTRGLARVPKKLQVFVEMIVEFVENITKGQMGHDGAKHIAIIGSLFLFILVSNLIGQLPLRLLHIPEGELASPTNDLNVTIALALTVSAYYFGVGIAKKKFRYFKHYLQPIWFMLPFNILEDVTKPVTLSLRLFANIIAGEIIVLSFIGLLPVFLPVPMMLFEIFVAFIQAFIFSILSATYIGMALHDEH